MSRVNLWPAEEEKTLSTEAIEEVVDGEYKQASDRVLDWAIDNEIDVCDMAFYQDYEVIDAVLVADDQKNGLMVRATLPDREPLEAQINALTGMGVDCYVVPETIEIEGREMNDTAIYATRDRSYRDLSVEELPFTKDEHEDEERLGEFFGYPEEEIEAYVEHGMWPKGLAGTIGNTRPFDYEPGSEYVFPVHALAREFEKEEDTIDELTALVNYAIRDDLEALENAIETAGSRMQRLEEIEEEYGVNITGLV